ncbi:MAG: isoprenyl transferase [Candidatus Abyssobacteria bacterium SURF_17]|uniref:Isoprenyl transferase n=1 Tax=Candidatus Abyssobacteria bacterium SURF_17 TaxID=2093361 RepID=A0A419F7Z3_9BACT|nr:MAG: isoprenyl transferase [Candidatus Abyssubacteria bacterium SURF_17]
MPKLLKQSDRFKGPEKPIPPALKTQVDPVRMPKHVAVIMDGNGRWAKRRGLPRVVGHRAGANAVREVVEGARELGVRYLTLYAFSSENWKRPKQEIRALMALLRRYLREELEEMLHYGIGLKVIGNIDLLPPKVSQEIREIIAKTSHCGKMTVILALSYGGRTEIVEAARKLAERCLAGEVRPPDIDEKSFSQHLYLPECPDPDLLIRTSGEHRLSNFLLWQLSYSEIYFTPTLWPDFTKEEFCRAIVDYQKRDRRYGGVSV